MGEDRAVYEALLAAQAAGVITGDSRGIGSDARRTKPDAKLYPE
jgi:hypothetical protein